MNPELAMKIANAVLYEGYMLYPYRPSAVKNRQRWSFGILYPPGYEEVARGTERSQMHSECLVKVTGTPAVNILMRFLHPLARKVEQKATAAYEAVPSLVVEGRLMESWDEAVERSVEFKPASDYERVQVRRFSLPGSNESEVLRDASGDVAGRIRHVQDEITGTVSVSVSRLREDLLKLAIDVTNTTVLAEDGDPGDRDSVLLRALLSAHTIVSVSGGEFVSLLDPPDDVRDLVASCKNVGNFPVLIGAEGERDMMLCSPIVLYDYPQIAPESAGDFYDATEMDEMLTLRVITLTEDEKDAMRNAGQHIANLLQRTEATAREQLARTHGAVRSMHPVSDKS